VNLIRVLLVDDHEMVTESFRRVLETAEDLEVVGTAATVEEAVAAAGTLRPDVVVMDYRLPDGDGISAAARILLDRPDAKILLLTGGGEQGVLSDALEAGLVGFLEKTSAFGTLAAAIRGAARGDAVMASEDLARIVAVADRRDEPDRLTRREKQILELVGEGLSNQAIADRLTLSIHTVRTHVQTILRKLEAHSKLEAVSIATRRGLLHR
jgi:two-component system, NarL family, response regulator DevR